jgi:hypothetical protein
VRLPWARPGARNLIRACDPSQNGFSVDAPHRHSATVRRPAGIRLPSCAVRMNRPRKINGPFSYKVTTASAALR